MCATLESFGMCISAEQKIRFFSVLLMAHQRHVRKYMPIWNDSIQCRSQSLYFPQWNTTSTLWQAKIESTWNVDGFDCRRQSSNWRRKNILQKSCTLYREKYSSSIHIWYISVGAYVFWTQIRTTIVSYSPFSHKQLLSREVFHIMELMNCNNMPYWMWLPCSIVLTWYR